MGSPISGRFLAGGSDSLHPSEQFAGIFRRPGGFSGSRLRVSTTEFFPEIGPMPKDNLSTCQRDRGVRRGGCGNRRTCQSAERARRGPHRPRNVQLRESGGSRIIGGVGAVFGNCETNWVGSNSGLNPFSGRVSNQRGNPIGANRYFFSVRTTILTQQLRERRLAPRGGSRTRVIVFIAIVENGGRPPFIGR